MTEAPIPGQDKMLDLINKVREPRIVHSPVLLDVSYISDRGMQAVVALANSLEWNVVVKRGRPVTLVARDGFKQQIPTDTSIRFEVFRNRVNAVITHSMTAQATPELMEHLIKQYKLDPSHARVFRAAGGNGVMDGVVSADEPDEGLPEEEPDQLTTLAEAVIMAEAEASVALDGETQSVEEPAVQMRVEPTLNFAKGGEQYISEIMDTIIRQLVPDGEDQITYRCKVCGLELPTKRGIGSHWQVHVKKGEAQATAGNKRVIVNKVPDYVPTEVHNPRMVPSTELRKLQRIISDVQKAVGQDSIKESERRVMVAERKLAEMQAEVERLTKRNESLERSLSTLHDLLGEIRETK